MVYRNQRGDCRCTSAVPWRSRTTSAPNCSITAITTPNPTSGNAVRLSSRLPMDRPRMPWPTPACSAHATRTPSMSGSTIISRKGCPACAPTNTAASAGVGLDRRDELEQRLRQGPGAAPPTPAAEGTGSPPAAQADAAATPPAASEVWEPCRWTLPLIRATFDWLADYSLSGVWRLLQRCGLRLRSARVQQFSPDPEYATKVTELEMALWEARRYPDTVVAVFLDQMGFTRWPHPAADWGPSAR